MGIRDKPTAPASQWQNGFVERLIGSIRRECVDHIEMHLRRVLKSYADYNSVRTHRSLEKDAPVARKIQRIGSITSHAILGGLHHHYARAYVFGTHSPSKAAFHRSRLLFLRGHPIQLATFRG
ncbi:integrase core domain-containing protein [Bradyrhizobium sp. AZCC 2289]|uniref:integrase core domain-containing protein n=1 Tax=Bradyrhizobium sp. AZCC 2289 TaxID=3117026 RepID=UPI003FA562F7